MSKRVLTLLLLWTRLAHAQYPCPKSNTIGGFPKPNQSFEIISILVDACDGSNEGENEMLRFITGPKTLYAKNFSIAPYKTGMVNWGSTSNPWLGFESPNANLNSKIKSINLSIKQQGHCGYFHLVGPNDPIPAYSQLLWITSADFNPSAHDFSPIDDTIWVAVQKAGNTAGHFVNYGSQSTRTLRLYYQSSFDEVSYDRSNLVKLNYTSGAEDGALVNFDYSGKASYENYGCQVPWNPKSLDAGSVQNPICGQYYVDIKGTLKGFDCFRWIQGNHQSGFFTDSTQLATRYFFSTGSAKRHVLYLQGYSACGLSAVDSVVFFSRARPTASISIDSSAHPLWCIRNTSMNADLHQWRFSQGSNTNTWSKNDSMGDFCFRRDSGDANFCLTVSQIGSSCRDSICFEWKNVKQEVKKPYIYLANVFTPGSVDGFNDELRLEHSELSYVQWFIYNRWGELVFKFEGEHPDTIAWNGQVQNHGITCPSGSYFYSLVYSLESSDLQSIEGSITLIR